MIIPSIDIMDGKAVQLRQGKEKVLEKENIFELAEEFNKYGDIAVIDLDAAMNKGSNKQLIKQLCLNYNCRVGGGIRTQDLANEYLAAGAKKIIIGTKATPDFLSKLPTDRIIVAIDTKGEEVVTEGWMKSTDKSPIDTIAQLENYCSEFLYTDVDSEGMLEGIKFDRIKEIIAATSNKVTIAGGISSTDDVLKIEEMEANAQIGMAIYTEQLDLQELFIGILNFEKGNGLVPTIVQDKAGQILMMANSTPASLRKTFDTDLATYFSRTRNDLWTKGMTSGNTQRFIRARYDCDRDALLFTVDQKNVACHTGAYSCFGDREFSLDQLYDVIQDRIENPNPNSYTSKIGEDEVLIKQKLMEEMQEVINYEDRENLVWELADVTYFLLVMMAKNEIKLTELMDELWRRRK